MAIAAVNGFVVDVPRMDIDSVDATVICSGEFKLGNISEPVIKIQLKATENWEIFNSSISFPLNAKNYNDLVKTNVMQPKLLVLFCLPKDKEDWVIHSDENLVLQRCAWWLNLKGEEPTENASTKTVYFPINQVLSPKSLSRLMERAANGQKL